MLFYVPWSELNLKPDVQWMFNIFSQATCHNTSNLLSVARKKMHPTFGVLKNRFGRVNRGKSRR